MFSTCPDRPPIALGGNLISAARLNTPRQERREISATISSTPGKQAPGHLPGCPAGVPNGGPNNVPAGVVLAAAALQAAELLP